MDLSIVTNIIGIIVGAAAAIGFLAAGFGYYKKTVKDDHEAATKVTIDQLHDLVGVLKEKVEVLERERSAAKADREELKGRLLAVEHENAVLRSLVTQEHRLDKIEVKMDGMALAVDDIRKTLSKS